MKDEPGMLPAWIQRAADRVIERIKADPTSVPISRSHGTRFWHGMEIEDGKACYLVIQFAIINGRVRIVGVSGRESQGPH